VHNEQLRFLLSMPLRGSTARFIFITTARAVVKPTCPESIPLVGDFGPGRRGLDWLVRFMA